MSVIEVSKASLYIHIPFCFSFCDYCDFYSVKAEKDNDALLDNFIQAVIKDIRYQFEYFNVKEIETAYIGGGTPSVLGAKRVSILLGALKSFSCFKPQEFTIEANPESADSDFLYTCLEGGINRISLGVQSFHEPSRCAVNRIGNTAILEDRLSLVSRLFPGAFSVDLITGLPYHNETIVLEDIKRLLTFKPAHISLYSLTVEEATPLQEKLKTNKKFLPLADEADVLWLAGMEALENAGYEHYEVSNFALPDKRCLHNIRYWLMDSWLGAGPAASGTIINDENGNSAVRGVKRYTFAPNVQEYIKAPFITMAALEEPDKVSLIKETLLMGYRYRGGPDREKFIRRFGLNIQDCIPQTLERWKNKKPDDIMLFLNSFLKEAFTEIDGSNGNL